MTTGMLLSVEQALRSVFRSRRQGSVVDSAPAWLSNQKARFLREVDILKDLTAEEMDWLKHATQMVTCEAGRVIYDQDDRVEVLFILKRGRVQLYRISADGKKLEIATIGPGTFFGEMPFLNQRMHNAFAEAVEESLICVLSREDVERLIRRKPEVGIRMLETLSERLAASESRQEALAFQPVPARLAGAILRLAKDDVARVTHQELADMIGAYRETVTKTLDEFQRDGLVDLSRGRITLRDRARIRDVAGAA